MNSNQNGMTPEDQRNLIIFSVVSLALYFIYKILVLDPQAEQIKQTQATQKAQIVAQQRSGVSVGKKNKPADRTQTIDAVQHIAIQNDFITGSVALTGGRLNDLTLNQYFKTLEKTEPVEILSPSKTAYPRYIEHGWITQNKAISIPNAQSEWRAVGNNVLTTDQNVTLQWNNGQGVTFEKTYDLDEKYMITLTQTVRNSASESITLYPYGLVAQRGLPEVQQGTWILHEGPIGYAGEELYETSYKKLRKEKQIAVQARDGWAGITDKYWLSAIIPPHNMASRYAFTYAGTPPAKKEEDTGLYQADYTGSEIVVAAGESQSTISHIYVGPKKIKYLEEYAERYDIPRFDIAVNFGSLWFLSKPFFYALRALNNIFGNFGIAIVVFTFVIRMAVFPLTNTSFKSFAKMKKASPKIMKLRKKYGDDKPQLQKELMAMYQKEGVNPLAGCIPMIIQIPIFFALYRVLFITIETRHEPFFGWIQDLSAPDPTSLFNLFGLIPWDPPAMLHIGVWPCLMLVAMIVQRKLNPPPQDPIQRDMALYFPFIMAYMMSRFASGLVIYWTFSALFSVAQQMFIMHRMGVPIYILGQSPEEKALEEEIDKGPAVHPLSDMVEDEIEHSMFEDEDTDDGKKTAGTKKKSQKKKGKGAKPKSKK